MPASRYGTCEFTLFAIAWLPLDLPTQLEADQVSASIPVYFYRLAESRLPKPPPDATPVVERGEPGSLILSAHTRLKPRYFRYQLTGSVTAPTGDETSGLSTGRATLDVTNHLQRTFGRLTPTLTAGAGDSTTLSNNIVPKTSTSLGPLAHFRAGLAVQFTSRVAFETGAVKQLPIGDQKTYSTRVEKTVTTTIVTGHNLPEHNGFNAVFDVPLNLHTVFSSSYSKSLRSGGDTVAAGLTYSLCTSARDKDLERDDLFR